MSSIDSKKLNQNDLLLIISDFFEVVRSMFSLERAKWLLSLIYFSIFGWLGLQNIRYHFGIFLLNLLLPWIAVLLYFNVQYSGLVNLLVKGLALLSGILWILIWLNECRKVCRGEYRIWAKDKWDEPEYIHTTGGITTIAILSLVLVGYQALYMHYDGLPYLQNVVEAIQSIYRLLPVLA